MAKEIVCYKNELNLIPMRNFNSVEMDLFFSICSRMKEKGTEAIRFNFEDLKQLSDYKPTSKTRFVNDIQNVYKKLLSLQYTERDGHMIRGFVLFHHYEIDLDRETVEIGVNPKLEYILNQLSQEFTKFELEEFTNLRSSYAKTAYRQLKRFRKTGYAIFTIEQFRELLCIPKTYQIYNINQKIIKPIEAELSQYFQGLKVKKVKAKGGRNITHIEFTFQGEDDMLPNGKYRIKKGKEFVEKAPTEMSEDEAKKVFPDLPKTLSEKLAEDEDLARELEEFLLQRRNRKAKTEPENDAPLEGQFKFDL
ncbi:MAG: replication initiation protein [Sulfurimonas sp.]|uniref:replication initiation protein n=1 Tax=Sulfurimonas sp. TaxID=2022749 RepID=UPI003D0E523D